MLETKAYDYKLPKDLIAQHPVACRTDARLMVVDRAVGSINHFHVRDLPELLRVGDCLVMNNTRVIPARLVGHRETTGGRWQGLYLESDQSGHWQLLCKCRGNLKSGERIILSDRQSRDDVSLRLVMKLDDGIWVGWPESPEPTLDLLVRIGRVPLPHYIRDGEMVDADLTAYQTVYATEPGSVAAPTAGLHFTQDALNRLERKGINVCHVTLHVGIGTFRPIASERLDQHKMHAEWGEIGDAAIARIADSRRQEGRIIAVGTTSARLLETVAATGSIQPWQGVTELFIRPPHKFRGLDALLTNFHLPRSTLLVLVRTFGGDELIREAYAEAVREEYRFFSYGDAMLIL